MPPSRPALAQSGATPTPQAGKRRRLAARDATPSATQAAHEQELEEVVDSQIYDPDQPMDERRAIRKGLRDLARSLNDSRAELMTPGSTGLVDTLNKANDIFENVKQTSDATLDSRLLVSAADLSYKKTVSMKLGDAAQNIDVDEFVSKCITFMRRGPGPRSTGLPVSSQRRDRRRAVIDEDDASDADGSIDGDDVLDWEFFGRRACFPHNRRPAVPGFLLGPLSVQKRTRTRQVRQGRQQRRDPADVVRPEELQAEDLEKAENSNLSVLCTRIRDELDRVQKKGQAAVEAEIVDDMGDAEIREVMERHGICDDGGVGLFNFVINPSSFGQTVENLFYVSFLIRDGRAGILKDSDGLPTLHALAPHTAAEIREQNVQKQQAILSLDHKTWKALIRAYDISEPMIPDRGSGEQDAPVAARG
ncbi:MAG: nuclear protein, partial [Thelocarpon impressellum]